MIKKITTVLLLTASVALAKAQCPPQPAGWSVIICDKKTEANGMALWIGKGGNSATHRFWRYWHKGESLNFPLPIDLLYAKEIWIKAATLQDGKNIYVALYFKDHVVKHIDEDGDGGEEHEHNREDTDEFKCR